MKAVGSSFGTQYCLEPFASSCLNHQAHHRHRALPSWIPAANFLAASVRPCDGNALAALRLGVILPGRFEERVPLNTCFQRERERERERDRERKQERERETRPRETEGKREREREGELSREQGLTNPQRGWRASMVNSPLHCCLTVAHSS